MIREKPVLSNNPVMNDIAWLQPGQSLIVRESDWKPKTPLPSYFKQYTRSNNLFSRREFEIQRIKGSDPGWYVTRKGRK